MFKFIFRYARKFWWQIPVMLILVIASAQINLELPKFTSRIINEGIGASRSRRSLWTRDCWQMIGLSLLSGLILVLSIFSTRIAGGISRDIQAETFRKSNSFRWLNLANFRWQAWSHESPTTRHLSSTNFLDDNATQDIRPFHQDWRGY